MEGREIDLNRVNSSPTVEMIDPGAENECIEAFAAKGPVITQATVYRIIARKAVENIVAVGSVQHIIPAGTIHPCHICPQIFELKGQARLGIFLCQRIQVG